MIQTGDPSGTGKGGQSIWGKPFADEVRGTLKVRDPLHNAGEMTCSHARYLTFPRQRSSMLVVSSPWPIQAPIPTSECR